MRKKSSKRIGDRYERLYKKSAEEDGGIVYKPVRTKWSEKDIFGIFDMLVLYPELKVLEFVQVKKNKEDFDEITLKKMEEFAFNIKRILVTAVYWDKKEKNFRVKKFWEIRFFEK
ncbi:MAG: hypothetical protein QXR88_02020 [Candidatus Pacearchaeota archaeon]